MNIELFPTWLRPCYDPFSSTGLKVNRIFSLLIKIEDRVLRVSFRLCISLSYYVVVYEIVHCSFSVTLFFNIKSNHYPSKTLFFIKHMQARGRYGKNARISDASWSPGSSMVCSLESNWQFAGFLWWRQNYSHLGKRRRQLGITNVLN